MSRTQKLAVAFMISILIATILLTAHVATLHAAPFRPPRTTPSGQRSTPTATATPAADSRSLSCDMRRRYSATSCDPNQRPARPGSYAR